jgi:CheY-like chemotaxis protein/two-component sensor histidine kinase
MLLLSRSLTDNRDGNLNDKQIEIATIMHQSGNDLLRIINDILDLSKIESGHEKAIMENVSLSDIATQIQSLYQPVAEDKGLDFIVDMAVDVPKFLRTDSQRLGQILRNLLSNAFKFTLKGNVILRIETPSKHFHFTNKKLCAENTLSFSVHDTGVGISKDSQLVIWEAFQQADGSISRQYGGTGLGLSISRELVRLLGGEIQLVSELNVGSTFSFYLPLEGVMTHDENHHTHVSPTAKIENFNQPFHLSNKNNAPHDKPVIAIADNREIITEEDNVILIVEDDPIFAQILANLCQENNNKYLVATTAHEALNLLSQYKLIGVFLDMELPEKNGWSVLLHIKETLEISHIPVYVVSANEAYDTTRFHGALDFLGKPVTVEQLENALEIITKIQSNPIKKVLVVEDDTNLALSIKQLLGEDGLEIHIAENGKNALNRIEKIAYDLVVLDLGLPDMTGAQLLEHIRSSQVDLPPVIVYTGRELTRKEYESVQYYTSSVIIKNVRSDERLLEEARLFLHRAVERLPDKAKKMLLSLHDKDALFSGKRVLLVDDDIRNVFSLSAVLEERGISIVAASCATEALEKLELSKNALPFDLVITDIMMPKMNGLELIRLIRAEEVFYSLPIIALTAKAMREDRINCIEAGASDYLTKPIDVDRLLSMMRVWLYR